MGIQNLYTSIYEFFGKFLQLYSIETPIYLIFELQIFELNNWKNIPK